jgi:radical SAM superfamily enzyme YgiQ (UPF0313 family)
MAAPAVLKACLEKNNISSIALDLNIEVLVKTKNHPLTKQLEDFYYHEIIHDEAVEYISQILHYCANRILTNNPTIIGLSLLTYECQTFTVWLCVLLRELAPNCKIIIGGPGTKYEISSDDSIFKEKLKSENLIDAYITGDGDQSFVEYIKGNLSYPGINSEIWDQKIVLDELPIPDYSDYNFFWYSRPFIPIVDAKGCVRRCEFCDVIEFWNKFRYRSANSLFLEMLEQHKKYKIKNFDFRSSISNGNLKEFTQLIELIVDYNKDKCRPEQFSWNASFIIRPAKHHPESLWENISASNGTLALGVESVIPTVRSELGKNFSNEDIDYHLEMAKKYNVKLNIMIITGYTTETLEDYEYTKQWFKDRKQYAINPVARLFLNKLVILPNTALNKKSKELGIINIESGSQWVNVKSKISLEQRNQYHSELVKLCQEECGFNFDAY